MCPTSIKVEHPNQTTPDTNLVSLTAARQLIAAEQQKTEHFKSILTSVFAPQVIWHNKQTGIQFIVNKNGFHHHHHHHHHHADIYNAPITTKQEHRCSTPISANANMPPCLF